LISAGFRPTYAESNKVIEHYYMQIVKKQEAPKQLPVGSQTIPAYRPSDVL
jgi:hypothetical protein